MLNSEKYEQTSINLTNVFDFIGQFWNYVTFDEIKWLFAFTKYATQKLRTKPRSTPLSCHELHLVHLILNAKKLKAKNTWKCIFRASRRVSFSYFSKVALDHWGCPPTLFGIFVNHIAKFSSSPVHHLRWNGNCF